MSGNAKAKAKGGDKNFADKTTFNPQRPGGGPPPGSQTNEPSEQDLKGRDGQFGGEGEPHMMKK